MPKLSVTIITKNEAAHIADALASVAWADEAIVVDSGSTDETAALAKQHGARVVVREWPGYIAQKNYAASIAAHDWILSVDADERVTPELAREIQAMMTNTPGESGYQIPRVTWHLGRWVRTTDWYPDYQLRFYDRRAAEWTGRYVHEGVTVRGSVGRLRGELQHFAYDDVSDHLETIDRYTTYAARQMYEDGRRAGWLSLVGHPPAAFLRNYLLRGGIRDGVPGLIISALNSYYVFLKLAKLWALQHPAPGTAPSTRHPAPHQAPGTRHQAP